MHVIFIINSCLCKTAGRVVCCPAWFMLHLQKTTYRDKFEVISVVNTTNLSAAHTGVCRHLQRLRVPCSIMDGVSGAQQCLPAPQSRCAPVLTPTTAGATFFHQPEQPCLRPKELHLCSALTSDHDANAVFCTS